jgi:hypothetical protein
MRDQASYYCDSCGEEIVVPIDLSAGSSQEYVEDCPVCCRPNVIHVEIEEDGKVQVWQEGSWMQPSTLHFTNGIDFPLDTKTIPILNSSVKLLSGSSGSTRGRWF